MHLYCILFMVNIVFQVLHLTVKYCNNNDNTLNLNMDYRTAIKLIKVGTLS
jgi:hypothetical protein